MNRWLISDTHFGHINIIKYENRPFSSVEEMDSTLIKNWNASVKKCDKIFVLGDFCFNLSKEKTTELLRKLKGYKILVIGNHDNRRSAKSWLEVGFNEVSIYPIIVDDFYIFSHKPLYMNSNIPYINVHGHIHSKNMEGDQFFNVSVEQINYKPILFEEIKKNVK
jgi:calcineurin-like phosphoesterase family protein